MNLLALDTSTEACSAALRWAGQISVREVEDIIFATAVTEYMKEAAEQAAADKEGAATQEEAPNE